MRMLKIIGYRIVQGHVTHITKKRKFVKTMDDLKKFEYDTASRYMLKDDQHCICYAIYVTI